MGQKAKLLSYLERHGSITRGEAFLELGIANLWARILELEARDWKFDRKSVKVPVRGGGFTTVTRYTLISAPVSGRQAALSPAQPPSSAVPPIFV